MELKTSVDDLRDLLIGFGQTSRSFGQKVAGEILLDAGKPLLVALQQEVPVGSVPQFRSGVVTRGPRKGQTRTNSGYYARGGALRKSLRMRVVNPEGQEEARIIAGASKAKGYAGWRAHFPIQGTVKMPKNDYQGRAFNRTIQVVEQRVQGSVQVIIKRNLKRYGV